MLIVLRIIPDRSFPYSSSSFDISDVRVVESSNASGSDNNSKSFVQFNRSLRVTGISVITIELLSVIVYGSDAALP